jgi:hypothetical protein
MGLVLKIVPGVAALGILAVVAASVAGNFRFNRQIARELDELNSRAASTNSRLIQAADLQALPLPVQRWLTAAGIVGQRKASRIHVKQTGSMRTKPDGAWMPMAAEQWFSSDPPAFIWKAKVRMVPVISLVARDKYADGRGNMLIRLLSIFPIADAKGREIDQGTLVRFLAETIWFPSAALNSYLRWESIDSLCAKATMTYGGVTASGHFFFNERGDVIRFEALRYAEEKGHYTLTPWIITQTSYREFQGVRIPDQSEVMWRRPHADFTWLKLQITELDAR